MSDIEVRPMVEADVAEASSAAYHSLREMFTTMTSEDWPKERTPDRIHWSEHRVRHILTHDPAGSWVATDGDEIVGMALATKRDSIWFLSMLALSTRLQGKGTGRRLLDAALTYSADCEGAWIMSSVDPKALRRYSLAGFDLHPGYDLTGTIHRPLLDPTPSSIRDGDWAGDAEFVDDVARAVRGAAYGPDQAAMSERGHKLIKAESGSERGFAVYAPGEIWNVAATTTELGAQLLMECAARGEGEGGKFGYLAITADQQWAIEVGMRLKLEFTPATSLCFRGRLGPMTAYIANGAYG